VTQGPLINMARSTRSKSTSRTRQHGARIVTGGKRHRLAYLLEPTVLANVAPDALVSQEKPRALAPVFVSRTRRLIAMCNNSPFGLASYFYSRDSAGSGGSPKHWNPAWSGVNTGLITTEVAPFGGVKQSGLGREGSHHGMEDMSRSNM